MNAVESPKGIFTQDQTALIPSLLERQAETLSGTNNPNARKLDAHMYGMVISLLKGELAGNWILKPPISQPPQPVIAVAHEAFVDQNSTFINDFVAGRSQAYIEFGNTINEFNRNQLSVHPPVTLRTPMPAYMLQLDNIPRIAKDLNIEPSVIEGLCEELPWRKAMEHYILAHSHDEDHNFPGYVRLMEAETGLTTEEFIKHQQLHELIQLLTHPLTERRFNLVRTWYNEGSGEYWARFAARSKVALQGMEGIPTLESLLEGSGAHDLKDAELVAIFHATSHVLIRAISQAYDLDNPDQGFFTFSQRLFGDGSKSDTHLSGLTKRILMEDGLTDKVEEQLQTAIESIVKA